MRFLAYDQEPPSDDAIWPLLNENNNNESYSESGLNLGQAFIFKGWKTLALVLTSILILFTVCGNAMTLYAVCKMKTFQNSISNIYIASLAAADMIVGAFVMTFMMLYTIANDGRWTYGNLMCDIWQAIDFISCTVSLYSICAIGFDRWLNLEKPLRIFKRNRFTAKRALAFVWIAPVLIWTPVMIGLRLKNGPPRDGTCNFDWRPTYVVPIVAVPLFYIPVFTLMILFVRISLVIRSHLVFLHKHSNQNNNTSAALFDLDRSNGAATFGASTPVSSRRRSANGSAPNLINGDTSKLTNGQNNTNGRIQKSKPPPLSPIVSVNLTAMFSCNHTSKSQESDPSTNNNNRIPNQSPLAMKVLRDRLSPKIEPNNVLLKNDRSPKSPKAVFDFDSEKAKSNLSKETTPLLQPNTQQFNFNRSLKRGESINRNQKIEHRKSIAAGIDDFGDRSKATPVLFQIGPDDNNALPKRSVSRESVDAGTAPAAAINRDRRAIDQKSIDKAAVVVAAADQKRSSVTSDTAVFFTKRFLNHKPPLLRAKTEIILDTNARRPRPAGRFSIISITTPLFSRKYSMNIFSDMFPQGASGITQQIRAAKAVGVILMFFLISWAPFLVLWPLKTFCRDCVSDRLYQLSIWANYLNSTLNPILYTLCSPRFQRVFRKHCRRCPIFANKRKRDQKRTFLLGNRRNV